MFTVMFFLTSVIVIIGLIIYGDFEHEVPGWNIFEKEQKTVPVVRYMHKVRNLRIIGETCSS